MCGPCLQEGHTPPPAFHVHVDATEVLVGLYPQSEALWFLPLFDESIAYPEKVGLPRHFILASDQAVLPPPRPGRGSGVFASQEDHPVVVPRSAILLEAFMRLYARDAGKRIGSFTMAMICYIGLYVDQDGYLDVSQVPEPFKAFYEQLNKGEKSVRQWEKEFKSALGISPDED